MGLDIALGLVVADRFASPRLLGRELVGQQGLFGAAAGPQGKLATRSRGRGSSASWASRARSTTAVGIAARLASVRAARAAAPRRADPAG